MHPRPPAVARRFVLAVIAVVAVIAVGHLAPPAPAVSAQTGAPPSLFDETIVRDFFVRFTDPDWQRRLDRAGESANVRADLTVDGVTYEGVGLRYKGLSSSRVQSPKKPFNLTLDAFAPGQRLYGFDTVNLNNSYADPSYLREVLTNDLLRPFLPTPRCAYAKLYLNGTYWGLYVLSEQIERTYVDAWFQGNDGLLVKADSPTFGEQIPDAPARGRGREGADLQGVGPHRPFGLAQGGFGLQSNLTWRGEALEPYRQYYEVKTANAGDAGYVALRDLTRALDAPVASGGLSDDRVEAVLPQILDVDSALWYLAATNAVLNYDSYYFGHNYFLYRAERDPRWYPLLWDTSLSFGVFNIAGGGHDGLVRTTPFLQETDRTRPLVRRLLAVPRWRADFLAHFRTVRAAALDAAALGAHARALRDLIRPALAADANQLYTLDEFEQNLDQDVSLGPGAILINDGNIPGILPLVRARAAWLDGQPALASPDHALEAHERTPDVPAPDEPPVVRVRFGGADEPVAVEIVSRIEGGPPRTRPMARDAAGWAAELPGRPARSTVTYYVRAAFADGRAAFHPESNWIQPYRYRVAGPHLPERPGDDLALNEVMADNVAAVADEAGEHDDWVELVNRGTTPLSLAGYFLGPSPEDAWAFALPDGTLQPGQHVVVWCDMDTSQGSLHAPFKLAKEGDRIVLATRDAIVDAVTYGPLAADRSWARLPDGSGGWADCDVPSPRAANACGGAPRATDTARPEPKATVPPPERTSTGTPPRGGLYLPWAWK